MRCSFSAATGDQPGHYLGKNVPRKNALSLAPCPLPQDQGTSGDVCLEDSTYLCVLSSGKIPPNKKQIRNFATRATCAGTIQARYVLTYDSFSYWV